MNLNQAQTPPTGSHGQPPQTDTRLRGRRLLLARVFWGGIAIFELAAFVDSLTNTVRQFQALCTSACTNQQLSLEGVKTLQQMGLSLGDYIAFYLAVISISTLLSYGLAAFLIWRRSDDWMVLLISLLLMNFGVGMISNGIRFSSWFGPEVAGHVSSFFDQINLTLLVLVFSLFPDGRFVPRWTRWILLLEIGVGAVLIIFPRYPSPRYSFTALLNTLIVPLFLIILLSPVIAQIYRYRRVSTPVQRQQTKWVVYGLAVAIFLVVGLLAIPNIGFPTLVQPGSLLGSASDSLANAVLILLPLSFGVAILRYRLYDIDFIINRTLLYLALTASVVGLYVLVVGYLSGIFHTEGNALISLVATGVVAVLFQPLRNALQRGVNRLFYGERDNPSLVLRHLGQRLDAAIAPDVVLPTIVETIATTLKLPYVAIASAQDVQLASLLAVSGVPGPDLLRLPLVYQHETLGYLLIRPRSGETLTQADRRLLADVARHAGVAMQTVQQAHALQQARERLVLSREEERRRLRRDLHDGLGPTLAALTLKAGSARVLFRSDPDSAEALMREVEADIKATTADIRRLVYALRPPVLDEQGLVMAIRECAEQCALPLVRAHALRIKVDASESLPPLPAAVELAAYRIVQEAVSNVARHAQAHNCTIRLLITDRLHVEISDDGIGLSADHPVGVGLISMRERAEELGGRCVVESPLSKGVHVLASLPLSSLHVPAVDTHSPHQEGHAL